ncbi:hypothetical protein [Nocardiopsis lambiniae]|uniref:Lipocalin-like domain-containing protein n=1 Tax=Nocardiopsis lambiniae TaxID=3075539 RepID=A0ABU2M7M8_9ACTN|nr:hypothetical protein [Nocardiopsis sp. DSM 44743]MDT0328588.1 hypothetical protein [Nocardiopsis sp. DSM 44743]
MSGTWAFEGRDAALAAFDRSADGTELAEPVREGGPRTEVMRSTEDPVVAELSFGFEDVRIELRLHARERVRTVSGTVHGDFAYALLEARRSDGRREDVVSIEETGDFVITDLRRGPLCLILRRDDAPPITTEWFTL